MNPQVPLAGIPTVPNKSKSTLLAAVFGILFIASAVFGAWAYQGRQNYKNNANAQSANAVSAAQKTLTAQLQASFDAQLKKPYASFAGPDTYGSISFSYPKTWSAYIDQTSTSEPINGYFYPRIVPGISSTTAYALRIEVVNNTYSSVIQNYQQQVAAGLLKAKAYVPAKLAKNANVQRGTRFDGTLATGQVGALIAIPVRTQTLTIYTESTDFLDDFNNIVLPSLTFSP